MADNTLNDLDDISAEIVEKLSKSTGLTHADARRQLDAAQWDYDLALSRSYEFSVEDILQGKEESLELQNETQSSVTSSSSRVATFASLRKSEDHSSDEEGQAFYAGGSVRSGQQILGPNKTKKNNSQIVEDIFKSAKNHGAKEVKSESHTFSARLQPFQGTGHVLGSTMNEDDLIQSEEEEEPYRMILRTWRNGFSVDDEPLRDYMDPQNKEFLDAIRRGDIPEEMILKARTSGTKAREVVLNIEDHRFHDYSPPKPSPRAFSGRGFRLGSPTPPVTMSKDANDNEKNEVEAQEMVHVDESAPATLLQIRLADGSKLVLKLNHDHTVGDIRRYIVVARPEYAASVFSLIMAYPQRELTDDSATIKDANLLNSVIMQKLQ